MRKSFEGMNRDVLIRDDASAISVTLPHHADGVLWDPTLYSALPAKEVRSGKTWRLTAYGKSNNDYDMSNAGFVKAFIGTPNLDDIGNIIASASYNTGDATHVGFDWFLQLTIACRFMNDNIGGHSSMIIGGGFISIGEQRLRLFVPSPVYDLAAADIKGVGITFGSPNSNVPFMPIITTNYIALEDLN